MRLVNHIVEWSALLALIALAGWIGLQLDARDAMGKCQAGGASFETCHRAIYR